MKELTHFANKEKGNGMSVLAKPINRITIIKEHDSKEFVRKFNENKASEKFLDSCKKAGRLFGKKNKKA